MVGTRLVILLSSDTPGYYWTLTSPEGPMCSGGTLQIPPDDWERGLGTLTGRGYNKQSMNYDGSCLPAAGQATLQKKCGTGMGLRNGL